MRKVKLHFTLVGNSYEWGRSIPKNVRLEWTNADNLEFVSDTVGDYFGKRALVIINEEILKNNAITYPKFYSAGWFISEDADDQSELVVVGHGENMAEANKSMIDSVSSLDWNTLSARI
ncbi:hypothetical protein LCGC14_2811830 [marine sediment metagenome]|uniref:Uncharacterized protein n=1 Tax=marine sediment metagenome TaxID=412755 RepID=A0A0F8YJM0_9ZZZZ